MVVVEVAAARVPAMAFEDEGVVQGECDTVDGTVSSDIPGIVVILVELVSHIKHDNFKRYPPFFSFSIQKTCLASLFVQPIDGYGAG